VSANDIDPHGRPINMTNAFRARADELDSSRAAGRFHSRTKLEEGPQLDRIVAQAIARAKAGDQEAFRFLYLRYVDNVYGYVRSIVRDDHEAEDVTQHVFTKLLTTLPKYQQREVPFAAWILRVSRNVAVDHMRARRAVPCEEVRELEPQHESTSEDSSLALREALASLPDDQREVIVLRHVVGLTPGEIAGRLGKTEPSIHGLHHRGRGALRAVLTERDCAPTVQTRMAA
jgi:RNA polymerase sigma-70 factor (ECF subfamily)